MSLAPEIAARLEIARKHQEDYRPGERQAREIGHRSLLMFVSPAVGGKSYTRDTLARIDARFQPANGFTTRSREKRDGSSTQLRFIPHTDESLGVLLDDIDHHELAQYMVHSTTGYMYGTYPQDYNGEYTTLDTISSSVENLRHLPFKQTFAIALVSKSSDWIEHFLERYPEPSNERTKRLTEGITSLEWMLAQPDDAITWFFNDYSDATDRGEDLIHRITTGERGPNYRRFATAMLRRAYLLK